MSNPLYHPQQLHGYGLNPLNTNYLPPYAYGEGQPQTAPPQQSSTPPQTVSRKRPKYQRSKQGCLSCRVRKVKVRRFPTSPRYHSRLTTNDRNSATKSDPSVPGAPPRNESALGLPTLAQRIAKVTARPSPQTPTLARDPPRPMGSPITNGPRILPLGDPSGLSQQTGP